ncbi:hypothetical protein [Microbacterium gorillae]|uniref:hypothetical protein n=1 Tax=Microbacterium gorillae TaxID=1231063 RepID=UPI003D96613E
MSITHSLISSRTMALAALYQEPRLWPAETTFTDHDIVIGHQSLCALVEERGAPCLMIAPTGEDPRSDDFRTVVITRVSAYIPGHGLRRGEVSVDCNLDPLESRVLDVRHLRDPNAPRRRTTLLSSRAGQVTIRTALASACRPGDLLALTCLGTVALGQIARQDTSDSDTDDDPWLGRCLK